MTTVLKLGGSVITEKDSPETLDEATLDGVADAIAASGVEDLVLVHGGGSFGHHHADRHGVSAERGSREWQAAAGIHDAMTVLNGHVLDRLRERDLPALGVHPFSVAARDADDVLSFPTAHVGTMLAEGFLPVLHGDVVVHAGKGVTIVSGDELVVELAEGLDADRVGLCSSVPGVLDGDGAVIPEIERFEAVADVLGASDATDVTGGMAGKVRSLLALDVPASIFGPDDLGSFLAGGSPGTRID